MGHDDIWADDFWIGAIECDENGVMGGEGSRRGTKEAERRYFPKNGITVNYWGDEAFCTKVYDLVRSLGPGQSDQHDAIPPEDIEQVWREVWEPIVAPTGILELQPVMAELYDYHVLMSEVSKVYDACTGGKISKPNTKAEAVIAVIGDYYAETQ